MATTRDIERVAIALIDVGENRRPINDDNVLRIAESMRKIGLQTPISVRYIEDRKSKNGTDDSILLVAGRHRLEAAKSLGWGEIDCVYVEFDDDTARMWEISENLHRAELTALERSEHVAEWIRLAEKKAADLHLSQVATNETKRADGRGHRQESGVRAAARELHIDKDAAHRAVKVASLSDEAKAVAREIGLDDNRSALLAAAKQISPKSQIESLRARDARKSEPQLVTVFRDIDRQIARLVDAWDSACPEAQQTFLSLIGKS